MPYFSAVTSHNDTSARRNGSYFKIEAQCPAVVIHGSAFSDDNSATATGFESKFPAAQEGGSGGWQRCCLTWRFSEGLAGAPGKRTQSGSTALIQSDGLVS